MNHSGSYIDSLDWLKNKKATIIPINVVNKYFQYATTVALNNSEIRKNSQRYQKLSLIIKYNWKRINYPLGNNDWKTYGNNNPAIAINLWYMYKK